jgi:hypothetical protein
VAHALHHHPGSIKVRLPVEQRADIFHGVVTQQSVIQIDECLSIAGRATHIRNMRRLHEGFKSVSYLRPVRIDGAEQVAFLRRQVCASINRMNVGATFWRSSMLHKMNRSRLHFPILLLLVGLLFSVGSHTAFASGLKDNNEPATTLRAAASQTTEQGSARQGVAGTQAADRPSQPSSVIVATSAESAAVGATPLPGGTGQASSSATAPTPLTPGQKFKYALRSSFKPPTPYALSAVSGLFSEATDNDHGRHMSAGDFLADSATHAARSMAFRVTANFFEKYAFAAAFHQDPRYFRSDKHGFARVSYALSRVVITRTDSGHNQFNASFFAGGLVTAGLSNVWSRPDDRTVSSTMSRFGLHVAYRGLSNVIHELFGRR